MKPGYLVEWREPGAQATEVRYRHNREEANRDAERLTGKGCTVDVFAVVRVFGVDAMGVVHRAEDQLRQDLHYSIDSQVREWRAATELPPTKTINPAKEKR